MSKVIQPIFISKYKPYLIDDFCIDENFSNTIKTLIDIDFLNILFIGNSGSGKTTLLYAMIREYYGLKKDSTLPENNILFINNLKEQGIQYFRNEMKTFCQSYSIIRGKKKIVVIDDIDTINEQSQQVFRNYIDKYRQNIHFISVCTNIQKVIESLQSRLHIIKLPQPTNDHLRLIMDKIIDKESIDIDEESKTHILNISNGSIRVLINFLEKMFIYGNPIHIELCKKICSNFPYAKFDEYFEHLRKKTHLVQAIDILYEILDYGYSVIDILDYLFTFVKITPSIEEEYKYKIVQYICKYITIFHNIHEDGIELAILTNNLQELYI